MKLLDGDEFKTEVTKSTKGKELLEKVCKHVGLEEVEFFGMKYKYSKDGQLSWLDVAKTFGKQIGTGPYQLIFHVKFYPPHPSAIHEDITRYNLVLQVRDDLLKERLVCSVPIHALLASYLIQAEKGDFDPVDHKSDYLKGLHFMPNQADDFLDRVREFHKKHTGLTPADSEFHYLDNARKIPLYGMDLHDAFDGENTSVILGVSESGFHVIQKGRQISKFSWSNVHKVYFKSKRFFLDIRVVSEVEYEDLTIGFKCRSRTELKRLYRSGVDHHTFFRRDAAVLGIQKVSFFKLGSRFRYSGRKTFQQLKTSSKSRVPPSFERVSSMRLSTVPSSKKAVDSGEKRKIAESTDENPEQATKTDSPTKDATDKVDDDSPCISRDALVVPAEEETSKDDPAGAANKHIHQLPVVSINILPPTPKPSPAHKHHTTNENGPDTSDDDSTTSEIEAAAAVIEKEAEQVSPDNEIETHDGEAAVTTETHVTETVVSSSGIETTETTTTTVLMTTTTTEIITIDGDGEEMVVVEETTETSSS